MLDNFTKEHWWKILIVFILVIVIIYLILNKSHSNPPSNPSPPPPIEPQSIQFTTVLEKVINEGATRENFEDVEETLNQRRETLLNLLGELFSEIGLKICGAKWNTGKPFIQQTEIPTMNDLEIILTMVYFSNINEETKKQFMSSLYLLIQKINNMDLHITLDKNNITIHSSSTTEDINPDLLDTTITIQELQNKLYSLSKLINNEQTFKDNLRKKDIDDDTINIQWERRKIDLEYLKNPTRITSICSANTDDPKNCVVGKTKELVQPCSATCENPNGIEVWRYPIIKNEQAGGKCIRRGLTFSKPCSIVCPQ